MVAGRGHDLSQALLEPPQPGELADSARSSNREPYNPNDAGAVRRWQIKVRAVLSSKGLLARVKQPITSTFDQWLKGLAVIYGSLASAPSRDEALPLYREYLRKRSVDAVAIYDLLIEWPRP